MLTKDERAHVLAALEKHPVRRCYLEKESGCRTCPEGRCRCEWRSQVFVELENPTELVYRRALKKKFTLDQRLAQAINNAQASLRTAFDRGPRYVVSGKRSLLVVQGPDGRCGLVTVLTDSTGFIERIVGCFAFSPHRLEQLAAVLRDACAALDDSLKMNRAGRLERPRAKSSPALDPGRVWDQERSKAMRFA